MGTSGCRIQGYSLIPISSTPNADLGLRDGKINAKLLPPFFPSPLVWAIKKAAFLHIQATLFAVRNNGTFFWIAVPHCWNDIFLRMGTPSQHYGGK